MEIPRKVWCLNRHPFPTVKPASGALQGEEMHLILSKDLPVPKSTWIHWIVLGFMCICFWHVVFLNVLASRKQPKSHTPLCGGWDSKQIHWAFPKNGRPPRHANKFRHVQTPKLGRNVHYWTLVANVKTAWKLGREWTREKSQRSEELTWTHIKTL